MPPRNIRLTFLGTCSGGGPLLNRTCSSSLIDIQGQAVYMVDCAEGTTRQFMESSTKMSRLTKIFITHIHADHCLGIVPLLSNVMSGTGDTTRTDLRIELFGPSGLRELIRMTLKLTELRLSGKFAVHELLTAEDTPYPCNLSDLHENENAGRDIYCDPITGLWHDFLHADGFTVDAGPILHRIRCRGYVFRERAQVGKLDPSLYTEALERNRRALCDEGGIRDPYQVLSVMRDTAQPYTLPDQTILYPPRSIPGRKLVILGDTSDPSALAELAMDASLLVHEATNAYMPPGVSKKPTGGNSEAVVRAKAVSRGHSTAMMAGEFAKTIRARRLIMNHFSARFPPGTYWGSKDPTSGHRGPQHTQYYKSEPSKMLREIERQATQAWHDVSSETPNLYGHDEGKWQSAIAAWDYMCVDIESHEPQRDWQQEIRNA